MSAYDDVTDALNRAGCTQKGHDWTCPVHKGGTEKRPALSVNEGDKGVVMRCHAGCDNDAILSAIGLKPADLFDEKPKPKEIVATYDYRDEQGTLLYQVVRYDPKEFRQRTPKGSGWEWRLNGVRRVPYKLPELIAAVKNGEHVWIVEGEKDVAAVERAGGVATCNSGGAGKWRDDYAQFFDGAFVTIVADKDETGAKHASDVRDALAPHAKSIDIVHPLKGKDAADHMRAGFSLDDFAPFNVGEVVKEEPPVNMFEADVLDIDDIDSLPDPVYLVEDFLVANSTAVLFGLPGQGKSFVALDWSLSVAHGRNEWLGKKVLEGPVFYVVAEGLSGFKKRKRAWREHRPTHTKGELKWLKRRVNFMEPKEVDAFVEQCNKHQPVLIVIDTLSKCLPGADENAPGPMTTAVDVMEQVRLLTQACVLVVHHTPKDGSTPRGHSSLLGGVDTAIKVARDGEIVTIDTEPKQKDGATLKMTLRLGTTGDSAILSIADPTKPKVNTRSTVNEHEVFQLIDHATPVGGLTAKELEAMTQMSKSTLYNALGALVELGKITKHGYKFRSNRTQNA